LCAGDLGGALILQRIYFRTGLKFVYTPGGWFYWEGRTWSKDESGGTVLEICREELLKVKEAFQRDAESQDSEEATEVGPGEGERKRKRAEQLSNFRFVAKMANVMGICKQKFLDSKFEGLVNSFKDILPVDNGVIDLRTGLLTPPHPRVSVRFQSSAFSFLRQFQKEISLWLVCSSLCASDSSIFCIAC
jgi:phage/plasmid-associated DNA primase